MSLKSEQDFTCLEHHKIFRNWTKDKQIKDYIGFDGSWTILYSLIEDIGNYNFKPNKVTLHGWKKIASILYFMRKQICIITGLMGKWGDWPESPLTSVRVKGGGPSLEPNIQNFTGKKKIK